MQTIQEALSEFEHKLIKNGVIPKALELGGEYHTIKGQRGIRLPLFNFFGEVYFWRKKVAFIWINLSDDSTAPPYLLLNADEISPRYFLHPDIGDAIAAAGNCTVAENVIDVLKYLVAGINNVTCYLPQTTPLPDDFANTLEWLRVSAVVYHYRENT